jgi:hypothetical protein
MWDITFRDVKGVDLTARSNGGCVQRLSKFSRIRLRHCVLRMSWCVIGIP